MAYLRATQYQKAIAPLKKVTTLYPKELKAYINLSYAYQETGHLEESVRVLEKAMSFSPTTLKCSITWGKATRN